MSNDVVLPTKGQIRPAKAEIFWNELESNSKFIPCNFKKISVYFQNSTLNYLKINEMEIVKRQLEEPIRPSSEVFLKISS